MELLLVASFVLHDRDPDLSFLGYVVFLQTRSCNEKEFPSFFNNIQISLLSRVKTDVTPVSRFTNPHTTTIILPFVNVI